MTFFFMEIRSTQSALVDELMIIVNNICTYVCAYIVSLYVRVIIYIRVTLNIEGLLQL